MNELATNDNVSAQQTPLTQGQAETYAQAVYKVAKDMADKVDFGKVEYGGLVVSTGLGAALAAVAFSKVPKTAKWAAGIGAGLSATYAALCIGANHEVLRGNPQDKKDVREMEAMANRIKSDPELHSQFVDYIKTNTSQEDFGADQPFKILPKLILFGLDKNLISKDNYAVTMSLRPEAVIYSKPLCEQITSRAGQLSELSR